MLRGGPTARGLVTALRCSGSRQQQQQRLLSSAIKLQRGQGCQALQVGETYHNFRLQRVADVPEYGIQALELQHEPTKAHYLHIDAKDTNNVFRYDPKLCLSLDSWPCVADARVCLMVMQRLLPHAAGQFERHRAHSRTYDAVRVAEVPCA